MSSKSPFSKLVEAYHKVLVAESGESKSRMSDSDRILYYRDRIKKAEKELQRLSGDQRYLAGKGHTIELLKRSIEDSKRKITELERSAAQKSGNPPQLAATAIAKDSPND